MSTISASTTTTTAYKVAADTTGTLVLQTGATPTTAVTIDGSQNVGVGVTPSAWYSTNVKALQLSSYAGVSGNTSSGYATLSNNAYATGPNDATQWAYTTTGNPSSLFQLTGQGARWMTAASGTAGNAITFTQAMTLDASSRLLVGLTSSLNANGAVQAGGFSDTRVVIDGSSTQGIYFTKSGADNGTYRVDASGNYNWFVKGAATANMTLDVSGNLLINQTAASLGNSKSSYFVPGALVISHSTANTTGDNFAAFGYNGSAIGSISQNGTTGVLYNLTSDYRLKNNQETLMGAKDFIMALKPKKWQWWDGSGEGVGFIAHEFMEVAKYSGHGEKDAVETVEIKDEDGNVTGTEERPVYQSIQPSSSEVMANLVAHIQNLETRLAALENK